MKGSSSPSRLRKSDASTRNAPGIRVEGAIAHADGGNSTASIQRHSATILSRGAIVDGQDSAATKAVHVDRTAVGPAVFCAKVQLRMLPVAVPFEPSN